MKNRKLISLLCLIICMLMVGTSIVACSSDSKKKSRKSSEVEDEDEETDNEDKDKDDNTKGLPKPEDDDEPIPDISDADFKSVIMDLLDCDEEDVWTTEGDTSNWSIIDSQIRYAGEDMDKYFINLVKFEDENGSRYVFNESVMEIEFAVLHDGVDGDLKINNNSILIDAEMIPYYSYSEKYYYGGIYLSGNNMITIMSTSDKDSDREKINELLNELNLKVPDGLPDVHDISVQPIYDNRNSEQFNIISTSDFTGTVKEIMGCNSDDIYEGEGYQDYIEQEILYRGEKSDTINIVMHTYDSEEGAQYELDMAAARLKFSSMNDADSDVIYSLSDNCITYNGTFRADSDSDLEYVYGGQYVFDKNMIIISTTSEEDTETVDKLIEALGFPKP